MKQIRLFRKTILFGYILIAILVGSVAYTSFYEWQKLEGLEEENRQIDKFRLQLHDAYVRMIELSLLGETLLEWDADDLVSYHAQRISLDSMLCQLKLAYPSERIDSLRLLLENKEAQMRGILQLLEKQDAINKKIAEQVPVIVQTSRQNRPSQSERVFAGFSAKRKSRNRLLPRRWYIRSTVMRWPNNACKADACRNKPTALPPATEN